MTRSANLRLLTSKTTSQPIGAPSPTIPFRYQFKTNELLLDLKYCLDNFAKPLLEVFKRTAEFVDQAVGSGTVDVSVLKSYIKSQRFCCRIFYSLNFMELPEFFEDHMDEWMIEFK
ncbi:Exportin-2 [Sesamum alatum]|uniref:Exportin-2 n=1 Tax=Sesamum alatum TaxID=300844 RepID=A0AAE2CB85_9LAMI|nr:Exportin-2 [Sesamum alatum]